MSDIAKLTKEKVMRPSLIDSVDKINEIIDGLNATNNSLVTLSNKVYELDSSAIIHHSTQGPAYGPLLSVTAKGHAEQDGTPTPSDPKEIRVVRGRNLLRNNRSTTTIAGVTFTVNDDGAIAVSGTATNNANLDIGRDVTTLPAGTYMAGSLEGSGCEITIFKIVDGVATAILSGISKPTQFTLAEDTSVFLRVFVKSGATANATAYPQFESGSTAHPYVPYGHIGLDVTADGTTTTTPIPLPSRGWVGSLPDSTADKLSIDGAGKMTWELATAMTNAAATEGVTGTVGVDVLSTTGEIADGATVLYKTTPTTEDVGYVDLPDIPEGAVVSMPELEGLGVESWTDDVIYRYVSALIAREVQ